MNFLVYSVEPTQTNGQINILKTTQTDVLAMEFIKNDIEQLVMDNNGKEHLQKIFIDSIDVLNNTDYKTGYYIIEKSNTEYYVYSKNVSKKIYNGWAYSSYVDEVSILLHKTYFIAPFPINDKHDVICGLPINDKHDVICGLPINDKHDVICGLTNSLQQSNIIDSVDKQEKNKEIIITQPSVTTDLDYTCYKITDHKMCFNLSLQCNGYCNEHQSIDKNLNLIHDKSNHLAYLTKIEQKLLNEIENTRYRSNKINIVMHNFDLLVLNREFVDNYIKFKTILLLKLEELNDDIQIHEKNIFDPIKYFNFFKNPIDLEFMKSININKLQEHINTLD